MDSLDCADVETQNGAFRLVTLRLSAGEEEAIRRSNNLRRTIKIFIESEVRPQFKCQQIAPNSFAFSGKATEAEFLTFAKGFYDRLLSLLFGNKRNASHEILLFAGPEEDVAQFLTEPEDEARKRSVEFLSKFVEQSTKNVEQGDEEEERNKLSKISGKRKIFYRGILLNPQNILIAFAMTPAANASEDDGTTSLSSDIDLTEYLEFRGTESIDFSLRLFNEASDIIESNEDKSEANVFLIPLNYNSIFSNKDRNLLLHAVRARSDDTRKKLILTIFNAPKQLSSTALQRFVGEFGLHFRSIGLSVTEPDIDPNLFLGCKLHSVTLSLNDRPDHLRMKAIQTFLKRADKLKAQKIRTAVSGIRTTDEFYVCQTASVSYLSGDAVTESLKSFAPAQHIDLCDLPISNSRIIEMASSDPN